VDIEARGLRYSYPDGHPALCGVSIKAGSGQKLAVIGANGSGKSTLLMLLSGCAEPSSGEIMLGGSPVSGVKALREATGLVFQDPDDQLFMPSVLEDVAFGLIGRGIDTESARAKASECLDSLGASHLARRPPHRMSGGEKRLAAIAGILVTEPDIMLLDEPTSSLDPRARREMARVLGSLSGTMIIATHDLDLARSVCDEVVILSRGAVCGVCGPELPEPGAELEKYGL